MESWVPLISLIGISLIVFLLSGMPVAFALGFMVLVYGVFLWGPQFFVIAGGTAFAMTSSYIFVAIPLFVLMAELLTYSGAGRDAFDTADKWIGWLPGGLGISTVGASALSASVVGISAANAAIVGTVAMPEMETHGYSRRLAAGTIAAGGTLGILIPPSLMFVFFGSVTELSVGRLFMAGVIPGLILAFFFSVYILGYGLLNPKGAPRSPGFRFSEKIKSLLRIGPIAGLGLFMLIALYTGLSTPTEVAGIGVLGSIGILLLYRRLTRVNLKEALLGTARISCMVMWIIIASVTFSHIMAYTGLSDKLVAAILGLSTNRYVLMLLINLILVGLGCFLDPAAIIMLTTPIFLPVIRALGFDPILFGVIFVINMEMGYLTPPFGMNLFVMKSIAPDVPMSDVIAGVVPFVLCQAITIALLVAFPELALFLVRMMI